MNAKDLYHHLSPLLRPFSRPYALLMQRRRERYAKGKPAQFLPACPTVSVGNIAWGGSGKTPFVGWLLDWAKEAGLRAVVLSRGYGASPGDVPLLVTPDTPAAKAGDEPLLLARTYPEAPVVVFPRRAESARFAEAHLAPALVILDDGMQHLAVGRDCDLVLLRPEDVAEEWDRVIPGGSWREGASALASATAFAMKIAPDDLARLTPLITKRLSAFSAPLFSFMLKPTGLRPLRWGCPQSDGASGAMPGASGQCDDLYGQPYMLISGVGEPAQVEATAATLMGLAPAAHKIFADHHLFTEEDARAIRQAANAHAPFLPILCTAKDAVKLEPLAALFQEHPVLVLEIGLAFGPALFTTKTFAEWWANWWQENAHTRASKRSSTHTP